MKTEYLDEKKLMRTSDMPLAAALDHHGKPVIAIDKNPKNQRVFFVFRRDKETDRLKELYWRGTLTVEPKDYFYRLKTLKSRIYNEE